MQKNNWETEAEWDSEGEETIATHEILSMPETHIQDVWASNFHEEMKKLMKLSERFNVIAMVAPPSRRTLNSPVSSQRGASWISATTRSRSANISW